MPAILVGLGALLTMLLKWFLSTVFLLLGIGFVTYKGIKPLYDALTHQILSLMNYNKSIIPIFEWLGVLQFDVCISIVISAFSIKLILLGLNKAGNLRKMRFS